MFFGALVYPLIRRIEERNILPALYLVIAILPLAIDGTVQFVTDLGLLPFIYESNNMIRFLTGAFAGFAVSFYLIPLLQNILSESKTP